MGGLRIVGSLKFQGSFVKEPYKRDDISLLILPDSVATLSKANMRREMAFIELDGFYRIRWLL